MRHAAAVSMQHAVSRQHAACSYWPSISLFCISICTDTCYCVSIRTTTTRLHGYTAHGARRTTLTLAHDVRCAGGFNAGPDASASIANMGYESGLYVRTSLCLGVQADVCEADVCGRVCRRVALPMRNLLRLSKSILIYPRHRVLPVGRLSFGRCILVTLCALLFSLFRPMIYLITPTYKRYTQKADLVGMGNTLRQVRNIHWIVVEDADGRTALVSNFLKTCGLPYTHVVQRTPKYMQRDICKVVNPRIGCTSDVHLSVPCLALPCCVFSACLLLHLFLRLHLLHLHHHIRLFVVCVLILILLFFWMLHCSTHNTAAAPTATMHVRACVCVTAKVRNGSLGRRPSSGPGHVAWSRGTLGWQRCGDCLQRMGCFTLQMTTIGKLNHF